MTMFCGGGETVWQKSFSRMNFPRRTGELRSGLPSTAITPAWVMRPARWVGSTFTCWTVSPVTPVMPYSGASDWFTNATGAVSSVASFASDCQMAQSANASVSCCIALMTCGV